MSYYIFFASDTPIKEYDNLRVKKVDSSNISYLIMSSPMDEEYAMRIIKEDDISLARPYSKKKYVNFIEWKFNEKNAQIIIEFIKEHLEKSHSIELWNTWMGDVSEAKKLRVSVNELSIEHISSLWGKRFFEYNECLLIYKPYE